MLGVYQPPRQAANKNEEPPPNPKGSEWRQTNNFHSSRWGELLFDRVLVGRDKIDELPAVTGPEETEASQVTAHFVDGVGRPLSGADDNNRAGRNDLYHIKAIAYARRVIVAVNDPCARGIQLTSFVPHPIKLVSQATDMERERRFYTQLRTIRRSKVGAEGNGTVALGLTVRRQAEYELAIGAKHTPRPDTGKRDRLPVAAEAYLLSIYLVIIGSRSQFEPTPDYHRAKHPHVEACLAVGEPELDMQPIRIRDDRRWIDARAIWRHTTHRCHAATRCHDYGERGQPHNFQKSITSITTHACPPWENHFSRTTLE